MSIWTDIATWRGPSPNASSARVIEHRYVVLHIADGTFEGTIAWQRNPASNVSSHFVVAHDGRAAQMLDTDTKSWTQIAGNPFSISVECEGFTGQALTQQQIEVCARILAKAHLLHGVPLQVTGRVGTPGLGHHSMGYESGVEWGHRFCPGNAIKAQKPRIVDRAAEIVDKARFESATVPAIGGEGDTTVYVGTPNGDRFVMVPGRGLVQILWSEWVASGFDKAPPKVLIVQPARLADFTPPR